MDAEAYLHYDRVPREIWEQLTEEEKMRWRISQLCLMDDDFMNIVFSDRPDLVELVLRIILEREDLHVIEARTQKSNKNPIYRALTFDILARDDDGKLYDIEIQRADKGASSKRARFHASVLDGEQLQKGTEFEALVSIYVIFITENDIFKKDRPLYHVNRYVEEADMLPFDDGSHIIYVNGAYKSTDTPIGKLIHDFRCKSADQVYHEPLAKELYHYKETERGDRSMCRIFEEYGKEVAEKSKIEGKIEGKIDSAKMMLADDVPMKTIEKYTGIPLAQIELLAKEVRESI